MTDKQHSNTVGTGNFSRRLLFSGYFLSLIIVVSAALLIKFQYEEALKLEKRELQSRSQVFAEHVRQILTAAKIVLDSVEEDVRRSKAQSAADLIKMMSTREVYNLLVARARIVPQVDVASIVSSTGDMINFTRAYPAPPINLSDRDYFLAHSQNADSALATEISSPVRNKGTGEWTFYMTRALRNDKNEFIGLVLTGINIAYLTNQFAAIQPNAESALSLFRADGILLARMPHIESALGKSFYSSTSFQILKRAPNGSAEFTNSRRLADPKDKSDRIVSPRPVPDLPLVVNITEQASVALESWRAEAWLITIGAGLAVIIILSSAIWLYRLQDRNDMMLRNLVFANAETEAANKAKSRFLSNISHEVRTPLNGILGLLGLTRGSEIPAETARLIRGAESSARHLLQLVNEILDLSRLEADKIIIERSPFSPRSILANVVSMMSPQAVEAETTLDWTIDPSLPPMLISDAGRLRQIIINLVGNAVKFTRQGTVTISVSGYARSEKTFMLRVEVADTGIGIPPEASRLIFQEFSQVDETISRQYGGTGLGLSISKRLVHLLGGEIGFTSKPGEGSVFWFQVPTEVTQDAETAHTVIEDKVEAIHPIRILVAEDNSINQLVIEHLLNRDGHYCDMVANGVEVLDAVQSAPYDVILMDAQMPEMDGETATEIIRKLPSPLCDIPIIMVTANAMKGERERYLALGANEYVEKPIDVATLRRALAKVVTSPSQLTLANDSVGPGADSKQSPFAEIISKLKNVDFSDHE